MKKHICALAKKMTPGVRRTLSAALCFLLSIIFLFTGRYYHNTGKEFLRGLTIQSEEREFSMQWLQSMLKETTGTAEPEISERGQTTFAAWTEQKEQAILDKTGGRQSTADVIAIYGSSRCLLPVGKNLTPADDKGCIIGRELAKELFGTVSAEGRNILWQDREWIVRAVVSEPSRVLLVEAADRVQNLHFNRISMLLNASADKQTAGESFLLQNNLSARILRWDYLYETSWIMELIPGEWSDFEGWKSNIEQYHKTLHLVNDAEKSVIESTGLNYQKKGRWLAIAGVMAFITSFFLANPPDPLLRKKNKEFGK